MACNGSASFQGFKDYLKQILTCSAFHDLSRWKRLGIIKIWECICFSVCVILWLLMRVCISITWALRKHLLEKQWKLCQNSPQLPRLSLNLLSIHPTSHSNQNVFMLRYSKNLALVRKRHPVPLAGGSLQETGKDGPCDTTVNNRCFHRECKIRSQDGDIMSVFWLPAVVLWRTQFWLRNFSFPEGGWMSCSLLNLEQRPMQKWTDTWMAKKDSLTPCKNIQNNCKEYS